MKKLENIFEAAAIATGCTVKYYWREIGIAKDVIQNVPLAGYYGEKMKKLGVQFIPENYQSNMSGGSTDMGNVSYELPAIHPVYSIHTKAANHTEEFVQAAKSPEAHEDTIRASKCLAATAVEVLLNEAFYLSAVSNFKQTIAQLEPIPETKVEYTHVKKDIELNSKPQHTACHC